VRAPESKASWISFAVRMLAASAACGGNMAGVGSDAVNNYLHLSSPNSVEKFQLARSGKGALELLDVGNLASRKIRSLIQRLQSLPVVHSSSFSIV
jgi:hypothetical protein